MACSNKKKQPGHYNGGCGHGCHDGNDGGVVVMIIVIEYILIKY